MSEEEEGGDKKRRACSECHKCKSKCVYPPNTTTTNTTNDHHHSPTTTTTTTTTLPGGGGGGGDNRCERCIRLGRDTCVPHVSRQGKRRRNSLLSLSSDNNDNDTSSSLDAASLTNFNNEYSPPSSSSEQFQQQQQYVAQQQHPLVGQAHPNTTNNIISNQAQIIDMIESMKNNGGTSGVVVDSSNTLFNSHMMGGVVGGGGGGNFHHTTAVAASAASSSSSVNNTPNHHHHHLAAQQMIQNNTLFAKNASSLLQQQQQQQQQHQQHQQQQQQSYPGEIVNNNNNNTSGLSTILSRAIEDSRTTTTTTNNNNAAAAAAASASASSGGESGSSGANTINNNNNNNFANTNVSGLSANLLSGMDPTTFSQMIHQLLSNNTTTTNSGSVGGSGSGSSSGGQGSNNLDLLYQAANSQYGNQQQQNTNNNNTLGIDGGNNNNNNNNTNNMMYSQEKRRSSTTGEIATYPSPQPPRQHNTNNAKSAAAAPASGSGGNNNNTNQHQIMRVADSRLKKQKKHHKYFPPEYPPISLLRSHSASGTPSSSQAGEGNLSRSSSTQNFITPEEAIGSHYMSACARHSELTLTSLKHHYGLQCQIREWISMALARRSFALLSKASSLAHRCNMHMDRILSGMKDDDCGEEHTSCGKKKCVGPRMHYLLSMLLEPKSKIHIPIEDRHMLLPHFPPAFLSVIGCQNGQFFQESEIRNRWIFVRETRCGVSRFFCSPAFERNVLCWAHVSQIYEDNLADIHSLIFVKDQFRRFLACNAYQIWSHSGQGMPPRPVHAPKTRVRSLSKRWGLANYQGDGVTNPVTEKMIQEVDDVMTLEMDLLFVSFPTMDKTTYYCEFFHSAKNDTSTTAPVIGNSSTIPRGLSDVSLNIKAGGGGGEDVSQDREQGSPESSSANPPTFDAIMESEEWVGIDDVVASGDLNELMDALLN